MASFGKMRNAHPPKQQMTPSKDSPICIEIVVIGPSWGPLLGLFVRLRVNQGPMTDKAESDLGEKNAGRVDVEAGVVIRPEAGGQTGLCPQCPALTSCHIQLCPASPPLTLKTRHLDLL